MKHKQHGFAHWLVPLAVIILAATGFAAWRVVGGSSLSSSGAKDPEPKLWNLGIGGFAPYDPVAGTAGPIVLNQTTFNNYKYDPIYSRPFYPFGDKVPNHVTANSSIAFSSIKHGTPVYAALSGTVTEVAVQHSPVLNYFVDDFEILIAPNKNTMWRLDYDHIQNVRVKKGDYVKVGQQVATTAYERDGTDRLEVAIIKAGGHSAIVDYCPLSALDGSVRGKYINAISQLETDLNSFLGKQVYDLSKQSPAGCIGQTVTEPSS